MKRADQKTLRDQRWDVVKYLLTFVAGIVTALVSVVAKGWYGQLRAVTP